jgi:hypothetical protein
MRANPVDTDRDSSLFAADRRHHRQAAGFAAALDRRNNRDLPARYPVRREAETPRPLNLRLSWHCLSTVATVPADFGRCRRDLVG